MSKQTERRVLNRILSGETRAFEEIIAANKRLVVHIVYRLISNEADRSDLCQDIFLRVFSNLRKFNHKSRLSTWIARIAYNSCINYLAKKKALLYDDTSNSASSSEQFEPKSDQHTPERQIEKIDIAERLQKEISSLPAKFRVAISLFHLDGLRYEEISYVMGVPVGTVKSYLFRGRKRIKERLSAKYSEDELCL